MKLSHDHSHTPEAIRKRLEESHPSTYLKEWVYGGIDGVVTSFAIVAAVVGASLSPVVVLILGLANLVGDGFSMAAGAYSSSKTENDNYDRVREIEISHIEKYPEGEREEIRQLYASRGFEGEDLEKIVETITSDQDLWLDVMMTAEYGITDPGPSPIHAALHTFWAFLVCGAMPLLPFVFGLPQSFNWAIAMSTATFFAIGAFKSIWSTKSWWFHGLETTGIGLLAAGMAYAIGYILRNYGVEI
jgi:VIT1/CCC1 family predicted Fe2+/Mn2+ transporter